MSDDIRTDDTDLKAAAEFFGIREEALRRLPKHDRNCALNTTHHLTCTCGAYCRPVVES